MNRATVELKFDFHDTAEVAFSAADFEAGKAMAVARAAAMFDRRIGEVDKSNDSGRHVAIAYLLGVATVREECWVAPPDAFSCENCEEQCEERSCCDCCAECCTCDKWYCNSCDEYQDEDESSCDNCDHCETCCECSHCEGCSTNRSAEYFCEECENCENCCGCCRCAECGDKLGEDHHTSDEGGCYCVDCTPEEEDDDDDD